MTTLPFLHSSSSLPISHPLFLPTSLSSSSFTPLPLPSSFHSQISSDSLLRNRESSVSAASRERRKSAADLARIASSPTPIIYNINGTVVRPSISAGSQRRPYPDVNSPGQGQERGQSSSQGQGQGQGQGYSSTFSARAPNSAAVERKAAVNRQRYGGLVAGNEYSFTEIYDMSFGIDAESTMDNSTGENRTYEKKNSNPYTGSDSPLNVSTVKRLKPPPLTKSTTPSPLRLHPREIVHLTPTPPHTNQYLHPHTSNVRSVSPLGIATPPSPLTTILSQPLSLPLPRPLPLPPSSTEAPLSPKQNLAEFCRLNPSSPKSRGEHEPTRRGSFSFSIPPLPMSPLGGMLNLHSIKQNTENKSDNKNESKNEYNSALKSPRLGLSTGPSTVSNSGTSTGTISQYPSTSPGKDESLSVLHSLRPTAINIDVTPSPVLLSGPGSGLGHDSVHSWSSVSVNSTETTLPPKGLVAREVQAIDERVTPKSTPTSKSKSKSRVSSSFSISQSGYSSGSMGSTGTPRSARDRYQNAQQNIIQNFLPNQILSSPRVSSKNSMQSPIHTHTAVHTPPSNSSILAAQRALFSTLSGTSNTNTNTSTSVLSNGSVGVTSHNHNHVSIPVSVTPPRLTPTSTPRITPTSTPRLTPRLNTAPTPVPTHIPPPPPPVPTAVSVPVPVPVPLTSPVPVPVAVSVSVTSTASERKNLESEILLEVCLPLGECSFPPNILDVIKDEVTLLLHLKVIH